MQTRFTGFFFSLISRNISASLRPLSRGTPLDRYSTNGNRPLIGKREDDRTEDFFRNLFGKEGKLEKVEKRDPNAPSPIPGRPLRGERQVVGAEEDLLSDSVDRPQRMIGGRLGRSPMRGEKGGRTRSFQQRIKVDGDVQGASFDFLDWKESDGSADIDNEKEKDVGSIKNGGQEKGSDRIGQSLFQKLKLGDLGNGGKAQLKSHSVPAASADSIEPESPPEDADEIFRKMKETGLIPNAVAMLDGLCKDGLVQEAMKLFGLMREKGSIPEVVIYTAVVEGFCKATKFDDAKRIFRKMQNNGVVPNSFSYSVIIQGFCKGKRLEDAVEFCMEMVDAMHSPNGATFTALIDLYSKEKGVKEAEDFVRSLGERGFALDEKAIREHLDKKGPYSPMVWEAIFGKKNSQRPF
ncbi:hypothetical protein HPP92_025033 [Vanilla planifolia]|uniref:Pentatricopeptide repeat-containing protein n=1 Tax=Vanilla planifolia TaxID=51239 RepID=A0A835U8M4_VANPL|nr:hypothetical protein HPP92_025325 [Vanilla planifolia]KAG0453729.1 hypothetical protein HPP92_025033 [Vanilla planifolia]